MRFSRVGTRHFSFVQLCEIRRRKVGQILTGDIRDFSAADTVGLRFVFILRTLVFCPRVCLCEGVGIGVTVGSGHMGAGN